MKVSLLDKEVTISLVDSEYGKRAVSFMYDVIYMDVEDIKKELRNALNKLEGEI